MFESWLILMKKFRNIFSGSMRVKYTLILAVFITLLFGGTLAYYSFRSEDNTSIAFDVVADSVYIYYDAGNDIVGKNLYPTDDMNDGIVKEIAVLVDEDSDDVTFNLFLDINTLPDALKHESFKWAIYKEGVDISLNNGNFSESILNSNLSSCGQNQTNHILLLSVNNADDVTNELDVNITTAGTIFTLYIWIDGENYTNPDTMMNQEFEFALHASGEGAKLISEPNQPKLTEGMIPVYYSESDSQWHKADRSNIDNNWYDYDNKMWANMVLLNSDIARETYSDASVGTVINMSDISAFYVWIPRYKYRVWNINRQACGSTNVATCEENYAYTAYSTGIEIMWESGTNTTGNVSCEYNPRNTTDPTTLSDVCEVNGSVVTSSSANEMYKNAWYTHPAFTFGDEELTGFWIGKFETTGYDSEPTILPDTEALVHQEVSAQFTTSRLFSTNTTKYGLSDNEVNAHMLKNLEWGAVAYLTHSIYGLCNGTSCGGLYKNNAYNLTTYSTTGRSSGIIADSNYSDYGTYSYDGYTVSTSNVKDTSVRDMSKVASTTRNIYGVYDMSGGSIEYVMANMYSIPTGTYVGPIGTSSSGFNGVNYSGGTLYSSGNNLLATVTSSSITVNTENQKYWDSYSYGTSSKAQTAWNRSRLGDAMGEVVSGASSTSSWKPGSRVEGSNSDFASSSYSFLYRGGYYYKSSAGSFYFLRGNGSANSLYSFRSSLS